MSAQDEHTSSHPKLSWTSNGPSRPTITDLENPELSWIDNDLDPFTRDCECEGPECDPDTCPRFSDHCACCGSPVFSGEGAVLLDGEEVYGDCCIDWAKEGGQS